MILMQGSIDESCSEDRSDGEGVNFWNHSHVQIVDWGHRTAHVTVAI